MPDPNTAFTAAALSLAAALAGCLPSEDSCTDLECSGNARLLLRYSPPAPESLVGGHLRICRNDRCNEETIAANGELYALGNFDPFSRAMVLARGILGDQAGTAFVASPVYKQRFRLDDGRCLDDPAQSVPAYPVRCSADLVSVGVPC